MPNPSTLSNQLNGIKSGILALIIQEEIRRNPHAANLYIVHVETFQKDNCYHVGFSTTWGPLSGRMYRSEYKIEDGKAVFVKNVLMSIS